MSTYPGTVILGGDVNIRTGNFLEISALSFTNFTPSLKCNQTVSDTTYNGGHKVYVLLTNDPMSVLNPNISGHKLSSLKFQ